MSSTPRTIFSRNRVTMLPLLDMVCRSTSAHTLFYVVKLYVDVLRGTAFTSCIGCGFCQRYRCIEVVLHYRLGSSIMCDGYLYIHAIVFGR